MRITVRDVLTDPGSVHWKTWGFEKWIENCGEYCGKELVIDPRKHTSMHFHVKKLETMYVDDGVLHIDLIDPENGEPYQVDVMAGQWIQIPRGQPHRLRASDETVTLFEFSTKHEETDSYRVEPSYKVK